MNNTSASHHQLHFLNLEHLHFRFIPNGWVNVSITRGTVSTIWSSQLYYSHLPQVNNTPHVRPEPQSGACVGLHEQTTETSLHPLTSIKESRAVHCIFSYFLDKCMEVVQTKWMILNRLPWYCRSYCTKGMLVEGGATTQQMQNNCHNTL